jgi:hypothetical protein
MLVRLGTSRSLSQIASQFGRLLAGCCKDRFMDFNNLIVLQFFGLVLGVAVLIMRSADFEPDEILAGNYSHLRLKSTSIAKRKSKGTSPIDGLVKLYFATPPAGSPTVSTP